MDRRKRRFVPGCDGLERREVLSTAAAPAALIARRTPVPAADGDSTAAETIQQRLQRVQNLPFFLASFQPGRFIPADSMKQVQENLVLLITRLTAPPTSALSNYNLQIRRIQSGASLSQSDANALNFSFGRVLQAAKAEPSVVAGLQEGMRGLARADADSLNPVTLAINDYSLVLQTALGIGRPLRPPGAPTLQRSDQAAKSASTSKTATPTFVGTYEPNSTMQIIDDRGNVVASSVALSNGQYTIKITTPLPNGSYRFRLQALDTGFVSRPSRVFRLTVKVPTTKGAPASSARF
ncbi:MAG: Ig-like domain-containing protein [Isosphaeraceae bacterium]|nr:Ig-like domain-containing protein [Isosphaeraceae bacterium]